MTLTSGAWTFLFVFHVMNKGKLQKRKKNNQKTQIPKVQNAKGSSSPHWNQKDTGTAGRGWVTWPVRGLTVDSSFWKPFLRGRRWGGSSGTSASTAPHRRRKRPASDGFPTPVWPPKQNTGTNRNRPLWREASVAGEGGAEKGSLWDTLRWRKCLTWHNTFNR